MTPEHSDFKVCADCARVYGIVYPVRPHPKALRFDRVMGKKRLLKWLPRYQRCSCGKPPKTLEVEGSWDKDFAEEYTVCHCCRIQVLRSGSKFSVWFCGTCKADVMRFNGAYGRTVIPIGRHSIMSGISVSKSDMEQPPLLKAKTDAMISLFDRIFLLQDLQPILQRRVLTTLQLPHEDVSFATLEAINADSSIDTRTLQAGQMETLTSLILGRAFQ